MKGTTVAVNRQPQYRVLLRPQPGEAPAFVRLRRLLKLALRAFGLRYVLVEEISPNGPDNFLPPGSPAEAG
jgi:hypothetical protein